MHSIGETIVYGTSGVMSLVDIREEDVFGEKKRYYVLRARGAGDSSLTFVPCDNEKLVSDMQPLISKDEIESLIERLKNEPKTEWIEDNRARSNNFKKALDSDDRFEILKLIRDVKLHSRIRADSGKKSYLSDDIAAGKAEQRIYSEFSEVLGIDYKDVEEYIIDRLEG